jgi:hypothetical protein
MPYCSLTVALLNIDSEALVVLHERTINPMIYNESVTVSTTVAIFAADDEQPTVQGSGAPAFSVANSGRLILRGVRASGTQDAQEGVRITGGAWVEQSRIVNNTGGGIVVDGGGMLVLENSFVGGNVTDVAALDVVDGAANILYATIAGGAAASTSLVCVDGTGVSVRNSLIVSRQIEDEVDCPNANLTDNALEMALPNNTSLGAMPDTSWFLNYQQGDFHLAPNMFPMAIETAATWQPGDPTTDIDGNPRPTTDASPDFAGADVIP